MVSHLQMLTRCPPSARALAALALSCLFVAPRALAADEIISVFENLPIHWNQDQSSESTTTADGLVVRLQGQMIERTIDLPPLPADQASARRIIARVEVKPALADGPGNVKIPGDYWTRLGNVTVVPIDYLDPAPDKPAAPPNDTSKSPPPAASTSSVPPLEVLRFITGFGGTSVYEQDVTALAPLLAGKTRIRIAISTYRRPAWIVSLTLTYSTHDIGYRRPIFAKAILYDEKVTADHHRLSAKINIPTGLEQPRLFIITSGHATDGTEGDEFTSRVHLLRIDRLEIARWRPWAEDGGATRPLNPKSGKKTVHGRTLWSSDFDRAGWHPGLAVTPVKIPAPELTPGEHTIDLEILGIRPADPDKHFGYWRVSLVVVADEKWPTGE